MAPVKLAPLLDGIPVVPDAATRELKFPLATRSQDQRCFNKATGNVERWSGSAWVTDLTGSGGAVREYNVLNYGAVGNGIADDAAGVQAAINAAPNGSVILLPPRAFVFSSATPTISGRTDLTFVAYGATITLAGASRFALKFGVGTNTRIRWYGGHIIGSGVLGDDQTAIGTDITPAGVQCKDVIVSDLVFQDVVRGAYFDVSTALGDASDITLRRLFGTNIVGTASGKGYGIVFSGVYKGTIDDCQIDGAQRHAYYISVCDRINLTNLRSNDHAGTGGGTGECILIIRSKNVQGVNFTVNNAADVPLWIGPDEATISRDTGNIQITNVTCINTAAGVQDIFIGGGAPATSSLLYNVQVSNVSLTRLSTATASGVEAIRIRNGTNIAVRGVQFYSAAAHATDLAVVYVPADGGDAYSDEITVEGVRAFAPNMAGGHLISAVYVGSNTCGGTGKLTLRNNMAKGTDAQAVAYLAAVTNPNIDARFNRSSRGRTNGTAVLVAGTVTVTAPEVLTGDRIVVTRGTTGGTAGHLSVGTITNRSGFVLNSSSATDTSTLIWEIVH